MEATMNKLNGQVTVGNRKSFILAGNALFTVVNPSTGNRLTFKVQAPRQDPSNPIRFVKLLNGPDNTSSYIYIGVIRNEKFELTSKSKITKEAQSYAVLNWMINGNLYESQKIEVWHDGRCGCCHRPLTVPESVASGIGPICARKFGA
jgi:hypothetical protein